MRHASTSRTRTLPAQGSSAAAGLRLPQQDRGQRRVECVLDAAASLIAEGGIAAATMQAIGTRAETSAGSLYHFFPDRNSVLKALAARHVQTLRDRLAAAQGISPEELRRLSVEKRIEHFVHPLLDHIAEHPDFLAVTQADKAMCSAQPRDAELDRIVMHGAELLVESCDPGVSTAKRVARATMLRAAIEGMLGYAVRANGPAYPALVRELKRMLVHYLQATVSE